jgi:hypothetical protein
VLILSPIKVARGTRVIVSGLLLEVKTLLTCRSRLNACVLNTLHGHGIEIASPTTARHISVSNGNPQIPHERPIKAARQQTVAGTLPSRGPTALKQGKRYKPNFRQKSVH